MMTLKIRGLGPQSRALFTPLFVLTFGGALLAAHAIMEATMGEGDTTAVRAQTTPAALDNGVSLLHGGITGQVSSGELAGNGRWWEPVASLEGDYRELIKKSVETSGGSVMAVLRDSFQDSGGADASGGGSGPSERQLGGFLAPAGPLNLSRWVDDHPGVLNPPPQFRSSQTSLRSSEMAPPAGASGVTALSSTWVSNTAIVQSSNRYFASPDLVRASAVTAPSVTPLVPVAQWDVSSVTYAPRVASVPVSTYSGSSTVGITSTSTTTTTTVAAPLLVASTPVVETAPTATVAPTSPSLVTLSGGSGTTTLSAPTASQPANIGYQWVTVGNPGNANDFGPNRVFGAVSYSYNIGQYDVTIAQYTVFLNAVAQSDPYSLYNTSMATDAVVAGIQRSGASGSYTYSIIGDGQRPVTYVSWYDAARFANWMQNGQPTGLGEVAASTENGAYALNGQTAGIINKKAGAQVWIPTENEWYKAAYYDPSLNGGAGGYWQDATMGTGTLGNAVGNLPHQANFFDGSTYSAGGVGGTTAVGVFSLSVSAYGTFDQSGNVYNWNDSVFFSTSRGLRGGAWDSQSASGLMSSDRSFGDPSAESGDIGFRLAGIPEPAGWISLMTGGAMLLGCRRRRPGRNDE
jgi:formylglycine-generating enzyme required for sulfatase activity